MPPQNENDDEVQLDTVWQDLGELFNGRYYYTIYIHSNDDHNRIANRRSVGNCVIFGIIFTFLCEAVVLNGLMDGNGPAKLYQNTVQVYKVARNYLGVTTHSYEVYEQNREFDPVAEQYSRPSSLSFLNIERIPGGMKGNQGIKKIGGEETLLIMTNTQYMVRFLIRCSLMICICFILYLGKVLESLLVEIVVRHIIAVYKSKLLLGLFRLRKIRA